MAYEELYRDRKFSIRRRKIDGCGALPDYIYVSSPDSVMIVPIFEDGSIALVRQFRFLVGRKELEFPSGTMRASETAAEAARRELREETGLIAGTMRRLGAFYPLNATCDEQSTIFQAGRLTRGDPDPDPTESDIEMVRMATDECMRLVRDGIITCATTALALFMHLNHPCDDGPV